MMDEKLSGAWREAGLDLGIEVIAPFERTLAGGTVAICEAFLPHFGAPTGAVVLSEKTARRFGKALTHDLGLWCSIEGDRVSRIYSRKRFLRTLEDFGWFGPSDRKPAWLSR